MHQRFGHHQPAFHPARQLAHISIPLVPKANSFENLNTAPLILGHAKKTSDQFQRFLRREKWIADNFLINNPERGAGLARKFINIHPPNLSLPARFRHQTSQNVDKGRLPGPIRTKQAINRPARDLKV